MKTRILIFALITLAGLSYGQEKVISGKSKVKKLFVEQEETKKLLPSLEIKEQAFSDKNSNQIIDAYETSEITFKIVNSGEGSATGVQVKLSLTNTDIKGLTFDETTYVGDIQANESKDIIIPIIATKEVQTGSVLFNIEVLEKNGLDAHPLAMRIETQKYTPEVTLLLFWSFPFHVTVCEPASRCSFTSV